MKIWQNTNKVIVSHKEVDCFNSQWPCSTLRSRSYWFKFDINGDLVDTDVPEQDDGDAASTLASEAQEFLAEIQT